jgi:hypothetical protein
MRLLTVERSPVQLFLFGLVGLLLMLGAVDVMWGHWVSTPPDTYNEEITSKGRNQRRADYVWGAFLLAGGAAVFGYAVTSLIRRTPVLVVRDDGVVLTVAAPGEDPIFVPWSAVSSVTSAAEPDPDGGSDRDVLVIDFVEPAGLPVEPWGASWDGNRLVIDATAWEKPLGEVVIHSEIAMERSHHFGPPPLPAEPPQPATPVLGAGAAETDELDAEEPPDG